MSRTSKRGLPLVSLSQVRRFTTSSYSSSCHELSARRCQRTTSRWKNLDTASESNGSQTSFSSCCAKDRVSLASFVFLLPLIPLSRDDAIQHTPVHPKGAYVVRGMSRGYGSENTQDVAPLQNRPSPRLRTRLGCPLHQHTGGGLCTIERTWQSSSGACCCALTGGPSDGASGRVLGTSSATNSFIGWG